MSDGPPPPLPAPGGPPPPLPAHDAPVPATDVPGGRAEAQKAGSAKALAGWAIGCTAFAVICCGGGTWIGAAAVDGAARTAEAEVEQIRAARDRRADAEALLDMVGDRLRADARELPATLPDAPPKDPWGNAIRYVRVSPRKATLTSAGRDGDFGTKDDVVRSITVE